MLYYLSLQLQGVFSPFRLFRSYTVLIGIAVFAGFFLTAAILPKCFKFLPRDRGREFAQGAEAAKGKPTGAGIIFVTLFVLVCALLIPLSPAQGCMLVLTWLVMLSGFLDDRANAPWGEYLKGFLDLVFSLAASLILLYVFYGGTPEYWLPFVSWTVKVHPAVFALFSTVILWVSINTTNCTDGVDGLSGSLTLLALVSMGIIFYVILGNIGVARYLLVPHLADGAQWAVLIFALCGIIMGYLWHNAYPSTVLMGDAGSRAIGFFLGICIVVSGNPFLIVMTSSVILVNGGTGLLKVALLRFFKIKIFHSVRLPLHDHMRKNLGWSPTQVLVKFVIMQILVIVIVFGVFFKIR